MTAKLTNIYPIKKNSYTGDMHINICNMTPKAQLFILIHKYLFCYQKIFNIYSDDCQKNHKERSCWHQNP